MEKARSVNLPLVSICIPVYNASNFITETLDCLSNQSYRNIEIIIVDDSSTDMSLNLMREYEKKESRLKVIHQSNAGAAAARNKAFENSSGAIVVFFDADDLVEKNFIESQVNILLKNPECTVVSSWGRFFNSIETFKKDPYIVEKDLTFKEWIKLYWTHYRHTTPPGRVMMMRKNVEQAGPWNEELSLNDDFEFFTRIFLNSKLIKYNKEVNFYYRSGVGGLSSARSEKAYQSYFETLNLSLNRVIQHYADDNGIQRACANLWQMFIYQTYPNQISLIERAETEVKRLGGANIEFPAGGLTKKILRVLGWKLTKRLKGK